MKPLILSFFAVILAYSLFFDKEKKSALSLQAEPINSVKSKKGDNTLKNDSINLYAKKTLLAF